MSYYYWDNSYRTKEGKTLQECFDEYGTGSQTSRKLGIRTTVIFLDSRRTFEYSWMLKCVHRTGGYNVPVKAYEENKVMGQHALNPK